MKQANILVPALGITTVVAAAASAPYFHRQNTQLEASHYVFRSEKVGPALDGFRIVQVSDLHNRVYGQGNCHLLALIEAQLPDLIVITGDLMDSYHTDLNKALAFARSAVKIAPCYFVTGNHEHRMTQERLTGFLRDLTNQGVRVLRNEAVLIDGKPGPDRIRQAFTAEDPERKGNSSFRLLGVDCQQGKTDTLRLLMEARDPEELNVLLSHKPHYADHYRRAGVDLVLTGHAHGGQWRLPLVGGLYAPGQGVLPKYTAGMYRLSDTTVMCVSRGLGNSSFPLRIQNRPELVTVTLHRA